MPHDRFFHPTSFSPSQKVTLNEKEHHHLAHVMRKHKDECIELVNGLGQLASARIIELQSKSTLLEIVEVQTGDQPKVEIHLAQALIQPKRLEEIVDKTTQLGVTTIQLYPSKRSTAKVHMEKLLQKLEQVAIGSLKQSGRLYLPTITMEPPLLSWPHLEQPAYFGSLEAPLLQSVFEPSDHSLLIIGPEGGFDPAELTHLQKLNAKPARLAGNTLRSETAAISGICLLQHLTLQE